MSTKQPSYDPDWQQKYASMIATATEAVAKLRPGQRVFVGTGCAEPRELVQALTRRARELSDTEIVHLLTFGEAPYADKDMVQYFRVNSFFIAKNVREVILGMTRDPQFGPMLMFGLGGIFVEVMKDVTFYLAPITAEEAMQMLKNTRSYALLQGARGQSPVDMEAIAVSLQRISQLVTDYPQIEELDINPYIVGEVGTEAYVADARVSLSGITTPSSPEHHEH